MVKKDKESIEELSHIPEEDLLKFREMLRKSNFSNPIEFSDKNIADYDFVLSKAISLKSDKKVYVFNLYDTWEQRTGDGLGEKVELYERHGDSLELMNVDEEITKYTKDKLNKFDLLCLNGISDSYELSEFYAKFLKSKNITKIYTGEIHGDFLGVEKDEVHPSTYVPEDDEDTEDDDDYMMRDILTDGEISAFEDQGIEVIVYKNLI